MSTFDSYDPLAYIYNTMWAQPERLMVPVERFVLEGLEPGARILDLCCGTGQTAAHLVRRGYEVIGIDGSESMLAYAKDNAPGATFILGDARTFAMPEGFDAVVSQYDSLNHILSVSELGDVFANVFASLEPGGTFLFDLNTEDGYKARWQASSLGHVGSDHAYVTHPTYDRETRMGSYNVAVFIAGDDGRWDRTDVSLPARCHSTDEVMGALETAGFVERRVFDGEKDLGIEAPGRNFYVALKPA